MRPLAHCLGLFGYAREDIKSCLANLLFPLGVSTFLFLGLACTDLSLSPRTTTSPDWTEPSTQMQIRQVFDELQTSHLTNLVQPEDGLNRIYISEQSGRILWFAKTHDSSQTGLFLDITNRVSDRSNEEGLLGLAFPDDFNTSQKLYVYYSAANPRRSVVSRFAVDQDNPDIADSSSEEIILEIPQPYGNHNGGQIAFGPDGYLYIGLGDGGSRSDPKGNGQDITTLLGSILRIDVAQVPGGRNYTVPPSNPFVDIPGAKGEIWAYGFRNPWRFSFDQETGEMWVADVGQDAWEEVNRVLKGGNYGWNVLEGHVCYKSHQGCSAPPDAAAPLIVYDHEEGCSVTGGYVYRGSQLPNLVGTYIYGDFCSGTIWGFRDSTAETAKNTVLAQTDLAITSFGQDVEGELYLVSQDQGIYQLLELP